MAKGQSTHKGCIGERFGRLIVIAYVGNDKSARAYRYRCQCDCGNELTVIGKNLRSGNTRSCGCLKLEADRARTTHGLTCAGKRPPEYNSWSSMIQRCTNPNNQDWLDYGGRGVTVCDRWRNSFADFLADLGPRLSKRHWLERVDNERGYEPNNCCWATIEDQQNNKRNSTLLTWDGRVQTLQQWANEIGISSSLLCGRLDKLGWTVEDALTVPLRPKGANTPEGEKQRRLARNAVSNAMKAGKLHRAYKERCRCCGKQAAEWHHHNGYDPEHHLDVVPVCRSCNRRM